MDSIVHIQIKVGFYLDQSKPDSIPRQRKFPVPPLIIIASGLPSIDDSSIYESGEQRTGVFRFVYNWVKSRLNLAKFPFSLGESQHSWRSICRWSGSLALRTFFLMSSRKTNIFTGIYWARSLSKSTAVSSLVILGMLKSLRSMYTSAMVYLF